MKNSKRMLVKIVREICSETGIEMESFSYDWILRLTRSGKTVHIFGYQFENNSATAQLICTDKCASSELLLAAQVPAVEHTFFTSPENFQYIDVEGNWQRMCALLGKHKRLVVKPNEGTGGVDVFQVSSTAELEAAVNSVFAHYRSLAICPYYEIEQEYRIILLNNQVMLVYAKDIPVLIGDGVSSIRQLILGQQSLPGSAEVFNDHEQAQLQRVAALGEKVPFGWKHNLGQGASPVMIEDLALKEQLETLALKAVNVLNANFASIDIVLIKGKLHILEVNSGIMMENFAAKSPRNFAIAKSIYQQAITCLLDH